MWTHSYHPSPMIQLLEQWEFSGGTCRRCRKESHVRHGAQDGLFVVKQRHLWLMLTDMHLSEKTPPYDSSAPHPEGLFRNAVTAFSKKFSQVKLRGTWSLLCPWVPFTCQGQKRAFQFSTQILSHKFKKKGWKYICKLNLLWWLLILKWNVKMNKKCSIQHYKSGYVASKFFYTMFLQLFILQPYIDVSVECKILMAH